MRFTLNGRSMDVEPDQVQRRLAGVEPEPVQTHGVRVGGTVYPVKQAFEVGTGVRREEFTSQTARRLLGAMDFEVISQGKAEAASRRRGEPEQQPWGSEAPDPQGWPWEGHVQARFARYLHENGWMVTAMADTATKAQGVDLLARKGSRHLGAEVKGWLSKEYADPRRAGEAKRTQPTTQAGHWCSQALMKAIMLLDSHPGHESLVVLPDFARYRDLAARTRTGREAAGLHVVFVDPVGVAESETWTA